LGATNIQETLLRCVELVIALKKNLKPGNQLFLHTQSGAVRLIFPELEPPATPQWQYLVARSHPWRSQLYVKGRKLLASTVWQDLIANEMSPQEAAINWNLPVSAIYEAIDYCSNHSDLIALEAQEELFRLAEKGVSLESKTFN